MTASFGIAMIGVAALLVCPALAFVLRKQETSFDLSWFLIIAFISAIASCAASHP